MDSVNNGDLAAKLAELRDAVFEEGWDKATEGQRTVLLMSHLFDQLPEQIAAANAQVFASANLRDTVKSAAMAGVAEALEAHPQQAKTLQEHIQEKGPWAGLGALLTSLGWLGQYLADHWSRH